MAVLDLTTTPFITNSRSKRSNASVRNDISLQQPNRRDHATESRRNKSRIGCELSLRHIAPQQREPKGPSCAIIIINER
jgi:hypothetical protein